MFTVFERLRPPTGKPRSRGGSNNSFESKRSLSLEQLQSVGIVTFEEENDHITGNFRTTERYQAIRISSDASDRERYKEAKARAKDEAESKSQSSSFSWPRLLQAMVPNSRRKRRSLETNSDGNWPIKGRESRSQSLASTVSHSSCECEPDDCALEAAAGDDDVASIECDPITLAPFEQTTYEYVTPCGREVKYSISGLVRYIYTTGEITDPVSRNRFTETDLRKIDQITSSSPFAEVRRLPSVLEVLTNREHYTKQSHASATILGLEACLGEIIVDILGHVETVPYVPTNTLGRGSYYYNRAEIQVLCLFSGFDIPFTELKLLSIERAYQAYKGWSVFLAGPAKKPTADNLGILTMALKALDSHWSDDDQSSLAEFRLRSADSVDARRLGTDEATHTEE